MFFTVSKVFWWFASPGNLLLALLLIGCVASLAGWRRLARTSIAIATIALLAISALPVRDWLMLPLENRFPSPNPLPSDVDGVIVLGAGIHSELSIARGQPTLTEAGDRLTTLVELALKFPHAKVVFSGGSANLVGGTDAREADAAKDLVIRLGLPTDRVIFERDSRNTLENAQFSQKLLSPQAGETWLLVTSAYHMPRAMGIFRKIGWKVTPYPVDYSLPPEGSGSPWAVWDGLNAVHWASREWFGLVYYRLAGYTDALFPGP